jgi:uncharacterized protein (DUF885 family)
MATVLNKDLVRESTENFEGREIMVTLTQDQKIQMKLKGMKSGHVSIDILKLFKQLKGVDETSAESKEGPVSISTKTDKAPKGSEADLLNELFNDIRSHNAISPTDSRLISHLDSVLMSVKEQRNL